MNINYKKATIDDLNFLTETRIKVLKIANNLDDTVDMSIVKKETQEYYTKALLNDMHTAFLIFDDKKFVGTAGISYFNVMPTYCNPSGKKAYIMNMYTELDYRRRGIAHKALNLLISDAKNRGVFYISLEATDMGRKLYKKFGFVDLENEMILPF